MKGGATLSKILNKLLLFLKNRLFLLSIGITLAFGIVIFEFYELQIIKHHYYVDALNNSIQRTIHIPGIRGTIYDRNGKEVATNKPVYVIYYNLEKQTSIEEKHKLFIQLEKVVEKNGDSLIDEVPISKQSPFVYTSSKSQVRNFLYGVPYDTDLQREELETYTAEELLNYLKKRFKIADTYTMEEVRKLIGIEYELYAYSYKQYERVKLSDEVSSQTTLYLQEQSKVFPGITVEVEARRTYPYGEALSSILGYTGKITSVQSKNYISKGYHLWEDVGQMGLEKSLEASLHGESGEEVIAVNQKGQRAATLNTKEASTGASIYLTIDADLQLATYKSIEKRLSEAIIERLSQKSNPLTSKEVLCSIIRCNTLQIALMQQASEGTMQFDIYQRLMVAYNALDPVIASTISLKDLLLEGFSNGTLVKEKEILLALNEQKVISLSLKQMSLLKSNLEGTTEDYIITLFKSGSLKPSQVDVTPSSGAAVIVNVKTGEVLSQVSYPTYDNNQMVSSFSEYWPIVNSDSRSLLWNRSMQTLKAPGSTFKMLTAIAGLEEGVITPEDEILDEGIYKKAGVPYPKCWVANTNGTTHGKVNLKKALAVSCNYYFYEVAMRLENLSKKPFDVANIFSYYGKKLGLDHVTGIELEESEPCISNPSAFLNRQLKTALNTYQGEIAENRIKRIQSVKEIMRQGILNELPIDFPMDTEQAKYYKQRLALAIEPMVQKELTPIYEELLIEIYKTIDLRLKENASLFIEQWIEKALIGADTKKIEITIKQSMVADIQTWVREILDAHLDDVQDAMNNDEILDAYETTYTQLYRQLIRNSDKKEEANVVKIQLQRIKTLKNNNFEDILLKIRQNMINIIVNDLLDGVELKWSDGITVRSAIGQGDNVFSPMQIARYIAAIANGKYMCDLTLVKGMYDYTKATYYTQLDTKKTPLDLKEETILAIHEGMSAVTSEPNGTAYGMLKDLGISIAAKTGTAEEGNHAHSWFVGFAPTDNPEMAVVVTLYDTDRLGSYGQEVAKDLISCYFKQKR